MSGTADGSDMITAVEMARAAGIDPKRFRAALRGANLKWHAHSGSWVVQVGSSRHADMQRVLDTLTSGRADIRSTGQSRTRSSQLGRSGSDETWIIDICDAVLGNAASRQHRFPFLLGDPGLSGRRASLPVDAYYPDLRLVVEYHERQHTQRVALFDDRVTVSGLPRGEQRRRYDHYRRTLLPKHGYSLVIFDYAEFDHTRGGRLVRNGRDREIVAARLQAYLKHVAP
ncbi:MAG: hypothetical protein C0465_26025 [Ralstonia sp.]|uniref:hypothetical protein n=1 Tax=Ralstonia sp. TaxID=54061 RepID=UPI00257D1937|nr:hypothetical protein [Ralstonia sp.]MBA4234035.1 hypothetical protein [Ralstonia sp.]